MPSDKQDQVERKTGKERFSHGPKKFSQDLLSFWQWACSDIRSNTWRGLVAEYIVALAVGCEKIPRKEWGPYDLKTPEGIKIEVKSSGYWQNWRQPGGVSKIQFSGIDKRKAQIYVFCVFGDKNERTVEPLNLEKWTFYVLPTTALDKLKKSRQKKQKTIVLKALETKLEDDLLRCKIDELEIKIHDTIKKIGSKN